MTLGELLRKKRKENGWSLQYLADKLNYTKSSLSRVERGKMSISFKRGLQLLKFLKVSLDDIDTTGELEKYITHEKPTTPKPKGPVVIDERYKVCRNCIYITKQLGSNINDIYPYYCKKHNFKEYPIDSFRCNDWEESEKSKKERECGFRRIK